jgi:hypothetical protein
MVGIWSLATVEQGDPPRLERPDRRRQYPGLAPADLARHLAATFRTFAGQSAVNLRPRSGQPKPGSFGRPFRMSTRLFPSETALFHGLGPETPYAPASACE